MIKELPLSTITTKEEQSNKLSSGYWRSLQELSNSRDNAKQTSNKGIENRVHESGSHLYSRKDFLRLMSASVALAGVVACRRPVQKILPYSKQPEEIVPGIPLYYATSMPFQDTVFGLLVETHEGRPTKIEGNDKHPNSRGVTNIYQQAAILGLYDPDRSRSIRREGQSVLMGDFISFVQENLSNLDAPILVISEESSSPTLLRLKRKFLKDRKNSRWLTYEAFSDKNVIKGCKVAFGKSLRPYCHFDRAKVIISIDDDFLNPSQHKNSVENAHLFSQGRKIFSTSDDMNRLYMIESDYSLTGSNADHRLALKPSDMILFLVALAEQVGGLDLKDSVPIPSTIKEHPWMSVLVREIAKNGEQSLLTAGAHLPVEVHALVGLINYAIGAHENTITYLDMSSYHDNNQEQNIDIDNAIQQIKNGDFHHVIILGGNPVFTLSGVDGFVESLKRTTTIHLSDYYDETSKFQLGISIEAIF